MDVLLERFQGKLNSKKPLPDNTTNKQAQEIQKLEPSATKAYAPWTKEDDKRLMPLHGKNLSVRELAITLMRGRGAIRSRLKKLELSQSSCSVAKLKR